MSIFDLVSSFVSPIYADTIEAEETAVVKQINDEEEKSDAVVIAADPVEGKQQEDEEVVEEEETDEDEEEEEEEEEDPEDPAPAIREACGDTMACKSLKHHYEECAARVDDGSKESCAEEFLHFMHCVDKCATPKIFATFK